MWQRWNAATKIFEKSSDNGATYTPLGLDASIITQGTFPAGRLPANVAYTNVQNQFTGPQNFNGPILVVDPGNPIIYFIDNGGYRGEIIGSGGNLYLDATGSIVFRDMAGAQRVLIDTAGGLTVNGQMAVAGETDITAGMLHTYAAAASRRVTSNAAHFYSAHNRQYEVYVAGIPNLAPIIVCRNESAYASCLLRISCAFQAGWNKNFAWEVFLDGYGTNNTVRVIGGEPNATSYNLYVTANHPSAGYSSLFLANSSGATVSMTLAIDCLCWVRHSGIFSDHFAY